MVAELIPERDMRGPGCVDRCQVVKALISGQFGRSELMLHDPDAHEAYGRSQSGASGPDVVATGPLYFDVKRLVVFVGRQPVWFSATELKILRALAFRPGHTVEQADLGQAMWGPDAANLPATTVSHAILVNVARVRRKLGSAGGLLTTVRGIGFRLELVAPTVAPPEEPVILWETQRLVVWARDHDRCRNCREATRPHKARGLCTRCYNRSDKKARRARGGS